MLGRDVRRERRGKRRRRRGKRRRYESDKEDDRGWGERKIKRERYSM